MMSSKIRENDSVFINLYYRVTTSIMLYRWLGRGLEEQDSGHVKNASSLLMIQ